MMAVAGSVASTTKGREMHQEGMQGLHGQKEAFETHTYVYCAQHRRVDRGLWLTVNCGTRAKTLEDRNESDCLAFHV